MRRILLVLATVGALLLTGCGGSSGPYRAECEREADRSGFGEGSQFRDNAIKGCEEALENTHAPTTGALEE